MKYSVRTAALAAACLAAPLGAAAQTGVSDDRVSLPGGPGSLEGIGENVSLDPNMGVMSYGVPIEVPDGFAGLTPALRLAYSSGAGSSVVGVGWSLDMPSIERATLRGLPAYGRSDMFVAAGGSELVELPGAPVPTYRARYEGGFVRYSWLDAGDGREGYWQAEHPDGRVSFFGATADGTPVPEARVAGPDGTFRYMVVETVDVYGHRLAYRYQKSGAVSLVRQIEYVFDDAGAARYAVRFEYEDRSDASGFDVLSDAKPGFDERLTQRLAAVNVFSGDDRIRRYELAYEPYADSGGFTRLEEVAMRGAEGGIYPAVQRFTYSRTLEGVCDAGADCERPFVIDMGNIGVNLGVGRATFVDINGDALPDLLDTTDDGAHRFLLNVPDANGRPRFDADPVMSAVGLGSGFRLGTPFVQVLDVDGDGFADLLDARNGRALFNRADGDWAGLEPLGDTAAVGDALGADLGQGGGELRTLRFIDLDNDKRIDLMRSSRETTSAWFNRGADGFVEDEGVDLLGYDLQVDGVQMSDMNGDGLLDAVKLNIGGLRYKLNLGRGRWGEEVEVLGLPLDESELDLATLDDINGDGLSDVVVVAGREVKFAINRNGETFSQITTLDSGAVEGELPQRDATVTVLMADINGNGSTDVVWLDAEGQVTALELFPVRPNQLARVENSLGSQTDVTYSTSVQMMARDDRAWAHPLPHPMLVVEQVDETDLLSGVRQTTRYRYRDGFYDGIEKRFRGFADVEVESLGDETQEDGLQLNTYDVGADDPYRAGLMLSQRSTSASRPLTEMRTTYADCPLAEVPDTSPAIRHVCPVATDTLVMEGAAAAEHVALRTESVYDGYGNVTRAINHGVVAIGGGACPPCEGGPDDFGAACGAECRGDESFSETTYVQPGADTDGRWILGAPFRVSRFGDPDSALRSELLVYYDGPDFEGLPLGQLTLGGATRTTAKVDDAAVIEVARYRRDAHGNMVEQLDALGAPGGNSHRALYTMDETGLRAVAADLLLEDEAGEPYRLRRELRYEPLFDKIAEGTAWMRVDGDGDVRSARRSTLFTYDEFGRAAATVHPGDTVDAPTIEYAYDLGSPSSRIIARMRARSGGEADLESVVCLDGRGRTFQTRVRIDGARYQVSGLSQFNVQGQPRRVYQPYIGASAECDTEPPAGARFAELFRDAPGRLLTTTAPDAELYGSASVGQTHYAPLAVIELDPEDADPQSPHAQTPITRHMNGLGELVALERTLADGSTALNRLTYDGLGRLVGAADAEGNVKRQSYDLIGRLLRVDDPNTVGPIQMTYDDVGNLTAFEDGRGLILRARFDGQNRLIEQWDDADRDGTRQRVLWDFDPSCDPAACSHTAGQPVRTTFPGLDGATGLEHIGYDVRGRTTRIERVLGDVPFVFEIAYDNADRMTQMTYPDGRAIGYRYDGASRMVGVDGVVQSVEYTDAGQLAGWTFTDGTRVEQAFDPVLRLASRRITGAGGERLQALGFVRDRVGNLLEIDDTTPAIGPGLGARFEYDAWYRTTLADLGAGTGDAEQLTSSYDLNGNVVSRASSVDETAVRVGAYAYEGGPNVLTRAGDLTLDYDEAGHVVQRGAQALEWDAFGRLQAVRVGDAAVARFAYGTGSLRTVKVEGDSTTLYASPDFELRDGISTLYVRLGGDRIARIEGSTLATTALSDLAPLDAADGRIDAADAWVALAAEEGVVEAPETPSSAAGALLQSALRRMFVEQGPATVFLHHDHQGSIVMATDAESGEVVGARAFHSTGTERSGGFGYVDAYGFTGQEHDAATGLINFEHRLLDPTTGRWSSADPAFAAADPGMLANPAEALNVYGYVGDNYANAVDPDGLQGAASKAGGAGGKGKPAKQTPTQVLKRHSKQSQLNASAGMSLEMSQANGNHDSFRPYPRAGRQRGRKYNTSSSAAAPPPATGHILVRKALTDYSTEQLGQMSAQATARLGRLRNDPALADFRWAMMKPSGAVMILRASVETGGASARPGWIPEPSISRELFNRHETASIGLTLPTRTGRSRLTQQRYVTELRNAVRQAAQNISAIYQAELTQLNAELASRGAPAPQQLGR